MSTRVREPSLKRASSFQKNRTSASWNRDPNNFSHLRGPNPSYDEHPDVDGNPLGHIRSTGPSTADPDSLVEDTSGASTPTGDRATTPTPGAKARPQDTGQSVGTFEMRDNHARRQVIPCKSRVESAGSDISVKAGGATPEDQ